MALEITGGGIAGSNLVAGTGTSSAVFTMPKGVELKVESVLATINNAAGADTTAQLTIRDQSGVVIATKRQGAVIPAGDTGTATFALRDDDGNAFGTAAGFIKYAFANAGGWLEVKTTSTGGSTFSGVAFLVEQGEFDVIVTGFTGAFHVEAPFVFYDVGGGIYRVLNSSLFDVTATQFAVTTTGAFGMANAKAGVDGDGAGNVNITIDAAHSLTVFDTIGNPLFRVDGNGDLHGKTGKALVFDL